MKKMSLLFLILALGSLACKNSPVDAPAPKVSDKLNPAVVFAKGNDYYISFAHVSGIAIVDWYGHETILRDTTIQGNTYYIFSTGEILRSSDKAVFSWSGAGEQSWYSFDVRTGDTTRVMGYKSQVMDVYTDTIFNQAQTVVETSNALYTQDTVVTARYATKFGMLSTRKSFKTNMYSRGLQGVKIDSTLYGSM